MIKESPFIHLERIFSVTKLPTIVLVRLYNLLENIEGGSHASKSGPNQAELPHHTNKGESNMQ